MIFFKKNTFLCNTGGIYAISLQEIEIGVKQIVKVCFMDLMYNIDLEGEHIKSCNMQQFYFFPNGQKYAIMI